MSKIVGYAGYIVFGVALTAMLSSLVLSDVFHFAPCVLCWYQRICMYPIVVVAGFGIIRKDANWPLMTLIFAGVGWLIALYQNFLQWGVLPSTLAPCRLGESCLEDPLHWLGFITIPFMSLIAFTFVIVMAAIALKGVSHDQRI